MYNINYFIDKFEKITYNKIGQGALNKCCAAWHCGMSVSHIISEEVAALAKIFRLNIEGGIADSDYQIVYTVNDHCGDFAKNNILKELYNIKFGKDSWVIVLEEIGNPGRLLHTPEENNLVTFTDYITAERFLLFDKSLKEYKPSCISTI